MDFRVCTSDNLGHIDYGLPIVEGKSDFRTSTGLYHRFIPEDVSPDLKEIKANIRPELNVKNIVLRNESYLSDYRKTYTNLPPNDDPKYMVASHLADVHYTKKFEERIFGQNPSVKAFPLSESQSVYDDKFLKKNEVEGIKLDAICQMRRPGKEVQPIILASDRGYCKYLDPYFTTNRSTYRDYTPNQLRVAREDLPTFYNMSGVHKQPLKELFRKSGNDTIFDRTVFKNVLPPRTIPKQQKRVPYTGIQTEYQGNYRDDHYYP